MCVSPEVGREWETARARLNAKQFCIYLLAKMKSRKKHIEEWKRDENKYERARGDDDDDCDVEPRRECIRRPISHQVGS